MICTETKMLQQKSLEQLLQYLHMQIDEILIFKYMNCKLGSIMKITFLDSIKCIHRYVFPIILCWINFLVFSTRALSIWYFFPNKKLSIVVIIIKD